MALPTLLLQWSAYQQESSFHYPVSISLLFLSFFFICLFRLWAEKPNNQPPSPPKIPFIGHLHHLGKLPHRSLQVLSRKYGPVMLLHMGQTPTLVISSAEMGEEIMKTHDLIFANRPVTTATKEFVYGGKDLAFAVYGEHWRQTRKVCILELLSAKRVQSYRFVREEEIGNMVNKIKQSCSMGKAVNVSDMILTVTNNIIARIALGRTLEGEWGKSEYAELTKDTMELLGGLSVEDMFPSLRWIDVLTGLVGRLKRTSKAMHQFYDEVIKADEVARKNGDERAGRRDFVDLLLDIESDSSLRVEFTRENFRSILMDMFVAATDTTFATLEWTMAELVNHPNVMNKLQQELRQVVGTKYAVDEDDIHKMEYMNCVIKEVLRLHCPIVFLIPRVSTATTTIGGYTIPAKTRVMINAWAISRDPKTWDKADEFIPERFENNPVDYRGQDPAYIPFGAGRRTCPGITFGITSVQSILANLVYWFDWDLPGGEKMDAIDMTEHFGLSVHLKFPLHLAATVHTF